MNKSLKNLAILSLCFAASSSLFAQDDHGTGLIPDRSLDDKERLISKPLGFGANLPKKVDLTQYVPKIQSQGRTSSCGGWSSAYYLATMEYAILNGVTNSKELETVVYDPYYTYLSAMTGNTQEEYDKCGTGTSLSGLSKELKNNGAKRRAMNEVYCGDDLSTVHSEGNSLVNFKGYNKLCDWGLDWKENTTAICQVLSENHPVLMGMIVPPSFYDIGSDGIFRPKSSEYVYPWPKNWGGHAMCIVGYDDDKNGGSFKVVNSWGKDWGDDGFLYINYEDFYQFAINAYSFETELKDMSTVVDGCIYGDCENGYGVMKVKGNGTYEGYFSSGEMSKGFYFNHTKKLFKGGKLYMKKMTKKKYGTLLYDAYDNKKPIGFKI